MDLPEPPPVVLTSSGERQPTARDETATDEGRVPISANTRRSTRNQSPKKQGSARKKGRSRTPVTKRSLNVRDLEPVGVLPLGDQPEPFDATRSSRECEAATRLVAPRLAARNSIVLIAALSILVAFSLSRFSLLRSGSRAAFTTALSSSSASLSWEQSLKNHLSAAKGFNISSISSSSGAIMNYLSPSAGAEIVEASAIPPVKTGRSGLMCSATSAHAVTSKYPPRPNECWWMPPPSGSGILIVRLASCVRPLYLIVQSHPQSGMLPAKLAIESDDALLLGEITWETSSVPNEQDQFGTRLKFPGDCVRVVRIRVTGHGEAESTTNSNGTCIHRLILLGEKIKDKVN